MYTFVFELARPLDVVGLVKARFNFYKYSNLLTSARGFDQRFDDRRVTGCAVKSLFDSKYLGVMRRLIEKVDDGLEAFVWVVQENVFSRDPLKDASRVF